MTVYSYMCAKDESGRAGQERRMMEPHGGLPHEGWWDLGDDDNTDRPNLRELLASLKPGDEVWVAALDRLAPSGQAVMDVMFKVIEKGASLRALDDGIEITKTDIERIAHLRAALERIERAYLERNNARENKKAGPRVGRPRSLSPAQIALARRNIDNGEESVSSMAKLMKVNKTTLWRAIKAGA